MASVSLYEARFAPTEQRAKSQLWRILCEDFFQRYVPANATVLDLGAGFCEFINHIHCARKLAVDMDPDLKKRAGPDVQIRCGPAHELGWLEDASVDVVFASNVFEHFLSKDDVLRALKEGHRVLKPGGKFLILQPNIRFLYDEYWDFFDHHLPFSDRAMIEGLVIAGFDVAESRPRFLPYTTKSALPSWPILVRTYLRVPLLQRIFGKQMFLVAIKR
jgi:SAM-dependent methyltransferase